MPAATPGRLEDARKLSFKVPGMTCRILYLVGFMGAGKTSVGRKLAAMLGWSFTDLDERIVEREGRSIREMFQTEGEPHFRRLETEELERVSRRREAVVALGGGAFCSEVNRKIVRNTGVSVWLDAPAGLLFSRCARDGSRPLLTNAAEMKTLLRRRRPHYAKADIRIRVSRLGIEEAAEQIRQRLLVL